MICLRPNASATSLADLTSEPLTKRANTVPMSIVVQIEPGTSGVVRAFQLPDGHVVLELCDEEEDHMAVTVVLHPPLIAALRRALIDAERLGDWSGPVN